MKTRFDLSDVLCYDIKGTETSRYARHRGRTLATMIGRSPPGSWTLNRREDPLRLSGPGPLGHSSCRSPKQSPPDPLDERSSDVRPRVHTAVGVKDAGRSRPRE